MIRCDAMKRMKVLENGFLCTILLLVTPIGMADILGKGRFDCIIKESTVLKLERERVSTGKDYDAIGKTIAIKYEIIDVPPDKQQNNNDFWDYDIAVEGYSLNAYLFTTYAHSDAGIYSVVKSGDEFRLGSAKDNFSISLERKNASQWEGFMQRHFNDMSFLYAMLCHRAVEWGK